MSKHIATHSHIKSLGLDEQGLPVETDTAIVGQEEAREASGLIVELVRAKKMSGRAVLLSGPMGSGKTALAVGISRELGPQTPFTVLSGAEVYSSEVKKTEILEEALRRSILVRLKEIKDVYEGEVTDLSMGSHSEQELTITLKSNKGSKRLRLSPSLKEILEKEKVAVGDVVYVESNSGTIKRLGRSESHMNDYDLEADQYIPLPKGEVLRRKEIVQEVTLHDLDVSNSKPTNQDVLSLVSQILSPKKSEITARLRSDVNAIVNRYMEQGNGEIVPGVLFVDEAHMLDLECYTFLHKAIESPLSPVLILATNKAMHPIRGAEHVVSPFGMPKDLLNRLVIINMKRYSEEEKGKIIQMRLKEEGVECEEGGVKMLVALSGSHGLRYCLSLVPVLRVLGDKIGVSQIEEVQSVFSIN